MTTPETPNLVLGDKTYEIATLPSEIQELITLYQRWGTEKQEAQVEVMKCDAAQRALATEITTRMANVKTE